MVYCVAEREFSFSYRPHFTVNYPCAAFSDKQHTVTGVLLESSRHLGKKLTLLN